MSSHHTVFIYIIVHDVFFWFKVNLHCFVYLSLFSAFDRFDWSPEKYFFVLDKHVVHRFCLVKGKTSMFLRKECIFFQRVFGYMRLWNTHSWLFTMTLREWFYIWLNPFTSKISLVVLLTVCCKVLMMLVLENLVFNWHFSLFSSHVCLILYWYCKEKFYLGHSWELKG